MTNDETKGKTTISVDVHIEIRSQSVSSMKESRSSTRIEKTFKKVYKDNSYDITRSLSGEYSQTEAAIEGVAATQSVKAAASISRSQKRISEVTTSSETENSSSSENELTFQPGTTQIYSVQTTTYTIFGLSATDTETKYIATGETNDPLVPGSDRYSNFEKEAWNNGAGVTEVPGSKRIKLKFPNVPMKRYQWEFISQGQPIPELAVKGGVFNADGKDGKDGLCFVGRFNNVPGKINTIDSKGTNMRNCWVQALGKKTSAEILTTHFPYHWDHYQYNMVPPTNAVGGLRDDTADLYVGKTNSNEIGKINTFQPPSGNLCNLWTHHLGKNTTGKVLIIESIY